MYDISKLDRWVGRSTDVKQVALWRDLLHDFGDFLPFLIDEKFIAQIPEVGRLKAFKLNMQKYPRRTFKTYSGAAWVLMAHLDKYAHLPDPFFKAGFLLPLEWENAENDGVAKHSELLPSALHELADKIKEQFKANGIDSDGFYLYPWHGFRDTVDFSGMNATFDSAWGALATGLFSIVTGSVGKNLSIRAHNKVFDFFDRNSKSDGILDNWAFSSIAFDWETKTPCAVSHLKEKISIVAQYAGNEMAVAPNQQNELQKELDVFRMREGTKISSFRWKWQVGLSDSLRSLSNCNQSKTLKRILSLVFVLGCVIAVAVLGVFSIHQKEVAMIACAREAHMTGLAYLNGWGKKSNHYVAATNFLFAAENGHPDAMFRLAKCYADGVGVDQNMDKMVYWYRLAAEKGHNLAMNNLGDIYLCGIGVVQDVYKAFTLYSKAINDGEVQARYRFDDIIKARHEQIKQWHEDAANGIVDAMVDLADIYSIGWWFGNVEINKSKAVSLLRQAADKGNPRAMKNLGVCYENGDGVDKDIAKAVELYQRATDMGNAAAMCNLGVCYKNGDGVEKDIAKAVELYQRAADKGLAHAMSNLGVCYMNGAGVEKDIAKAEMWVRKAIDCGLVEAKPVLEEVQKRKSISL